MPGGEREKKCWYVGVSTGGRPNSGFRLRSSRSVCRARGSRGRFASALTRKGALVSPASYLLSGTSFHIRPFSCGTSSGSSRKAKCLMTIMRFSPGDISRDQLYRRYPAAHRHAASSALQISLGSEFSWAGAGDYSGADRWKPSMGAGRRSSLSSLFACRALQDDGPI